MRISRIGDLYFLFYFNKGGTVMEITLYRNLSESIVVEKNLKEMFPTRAVMKEECSVLTPSLVLLLKGDMVKTNYCYIPSFGRYYYTTVTVLDNDRCRIDCKVDVLMTYKEHIKLTKQNVVRQEKQFNMYLEDSNMQVLSKTIRQTLNFKNGYKLQNGILNDSYCYVLNTL